MIKLGRSRRLEAATYLPEAAFPLSLLVREQQEDSLPHKHEFSELVVVGTGEGVHVHGKNVYQIYAGDVFVIRENIIHSYANTSNLTLLNLVFNPETLPMMHYDIESLPGYHALFTLEPQVRFTGGKKALLHLSLNELERVKGLLLQMDDELRGKGRGHHFMAMGLFMQIVTFLSRCYEAQKTPAAHTILRLGEAMSYLSENFYRDVSLEELSEHAHMSSRTLTRLFQKYVNHSPINYLIRLRVARAAEFLRETDYPVTRIAYDCGFSDSNYFSRTFKSLMGLTPRDYRKNLK